MSDIYEEAIRRGIKVDNHESDLYIEGTAAGMALVMEFPDRSSSTFRSEIDGRLWVEVPFAYTPFWGQRAR